MCHHCNCQSTPNKAAPGELPVITPHSYPNRYSGGVAPMPVRSSGGAGVGIFLLCLGVLGGGFGLAIASPVLVVKGGFCVLFGLIRVVTS